MTEQKEHFYGRRKGKKLRSGRAELVETLLPQLAVDAAEFGNWREVWLEIGFGAGEHLAAHAGANPVVLMVGCEPFINGVSTLLARIEGEGLKNIRIHANDARPLLDALPDGCISRAFVLFPDPWPKKRHWERRFIGPANLDRLARLLKSGAELRLASDDPDLQGWMLRHTRRHGAFRWVVERCHDWLVRPADWPPTRYEQKAIRGRPVFLRFQKI